MLIIMTTTLHHHLKFFMKKFDCIKDFTTIKEKCIFCDTPLIFVLTNWFGVNKPGLPLINSSLKNDCFNFKFKYNSPSANINTEGSLNVITNIVTFRDPSKFPLTVSNPVDVMANVLGSLHPHVELQCNNRKCKMNYYVSSDAFAFHIHRMNPENDESFNPDTDTVFVKPFPLLMECFTIKNLWIQTNYIDKTTMIAILDEGATPDKSVIVPQLNFDNLSKEKIINKVKTMVTFS